MDKKKMTKKGTHIVKRLLAAVCTAALVLGLMPGNLGTMSVQAEATTINLSNISGDMNSPTNLPAGSIIKNDWGCELYNIFFVAEINDLTGGNYAALGSLADGGEVTILSSYTLGNERTISANSWSAYIDSQSLVLWPAADTKTATTTTLSAASITVTEGETWELTAQAKADGTNVDGATVVYYSDEDLKTKLSDDPTAVGTYYARGEYYGSDSYEASNSEIITVTIKEKTPEKNYDIKASEISGDVSKPTEISAGTKILVDSKWGASLYVLSYVNAVELGYITDESVTDGDKGPYYWATDFKQNDTITIESAYTANGMNGTSGTIAITQEEKWYAIYHSGTDQLFIYTATPPKKVTAPTISDDDQPANASVKVGETATFTVTATGDDLTYQWQIDRNDSKGFVDIDDATAASYTTGTVDVSCNGYKYHCIVTNTAGSVTTNDVTLTVTSDEPQTHKHTLVHHDAVAATTTATGTKEYWQCSDCKKYFSDAEGKNEISAPEVIDKLTPSDSGSSDSGDTSSSDSSSESTRTTTSTTTAATTTESTAAATTVSSANIAEVGAGTLSVEAAIDTTAPAAAIATPASDILSILGLDGTLTVDEVNGIIAGNIDVEVILGVTNSESTMTQASRDLIKEKADAEGMTIAEYMDITLTKYVIPAGQLRESVTGTRIEKLTSGSVAITVTIPEAFKNTDASVIRTYYVLRNHDGEVSVLNGTLSTDAAEFTFVTDKFSDYVLTYKDTAVSTTTDTAAATTVATAPKTGDTTPVIWSFVLLLGSMAGLVFTKKQH